jgi:hypothetical protein
MNNKTMPWSKFVSGTALGVAGVIATGVAGPNILNKVLGTAGTYIGYKLDGEMGCSYRR